MLQVWRGLEEQPGEDNWHNAGVPTITWDKCLDSKYSTQYVQHIFNTSGCFGPHTWACKDCSYSGRTWQTHVSWNTKELRRQQVFKTLLCTGQPWWSWSWSRAGRTSSLHLPAPLHPCFEELSSSEDGNKQTYPAFRNTVPTLFTMWHYLGRKKSAETDVLVY